MRETEDRAKAIVLGSIAERIDTWWSSLAPEEKASGFDEMISRWGSIEIIGILAEKYFNQKAELAQRLQGATSIAYRRREIKTVLAYVDKAHGGGAERVACLLCQIWVSMGYRVILATNGKPTGEDYSLPEEVERVVLKNHDYADYAKGKNYGKRAEEWAQILRDYEVDAVVYHQYLTPEPFWDVLTMKTNGVAVIGFWHGAFARGFASKWEKISDYFAYCELVDALVVLSDTDRKFFQYYNGNVHVTINPLTENPQEWKRSQFVMKHDILWLARLHPIKNPLDTIPIMKAVLPEVPDAVLHVVGKSADGKLEKILERRIKEENLDGHIILEGFSTDVKPWYLSSRIFLMTSDLEGYPMTLAESKMAGIPCVMYELPYLTLCEGNRGILPVPQHDTKAAAKAIIRLLQGDAFCEQCGKEARAHIEELAQFDFQKKWREIFESVETGHADNVSPDEKRMMDMLVGEYMKENDRATKKESDWKNSEAKNRKLSKELRDIRQGYSFRIGRIVTWLPRKLRGGIKCFRQHGMVYTAKRTLEHMGINMGTKDFARRK